MHYVSISKDTYFSNTLDNMPRNCSTFAGLTNHANNDHEYYPTGDLVVRRLMGPRSHRGSSNTSGSDTAVSL